MKVPFGYHGFQVIALIGYLQISWIVCPSVAFSPTLKPLSIPTLPQQTASNGLCAPNRRASTALFAQDEPNDENNEESLNDNEETKLDEEEYPPLPMLDASVLIPYVLFISFWPLLALLRLKWGTLFPYGSPIDYFDIDKYMALQGMMQEANVSPDEIVELPALSPAEQLVGAIFGPPPRP
ncbi:expressed unknown protein [Seminavis robusta]|uniref:Uncharacterized protein n=1 Tax=Seminavis robusta TaxID=568900 RepID=A0A9N8DIL5_9STRA|nr:expressed unknown protein [Seminavis robusta]|eukprot:Sro82_g043990.1 n/a (181) ;mRNA; f:89048-89590